jgi:hypothetical protein
VKTPMWLSGVTDVPKNQLQYDISGVREFTYRRESTDGI